MYETRPAGALPESGTTQQEVQIQGISKAISARWHRDRPEFPWAKYCKSKGAAKLHIGLDAVGYLPAFVDLSEGKEHKINMAKQLELPKNSYVVFDRGYTNCSWYQEFTESDIRFVTRP